MSVQGRRDAVFVDRIPWSAFNIQTGRMLVGLDQAGVACSTGSACASGSSEPSPVLLAMGCDDGVVEGSLRISLGASTSAAQVHQAARRILIVAKDLYSRNRTGNSAKGPRETATKSI